MSRTYCVYIMTNRSRTLYTGVTSNLTRRVYQHKHHLIEGFTSQYKVDQLAYYEQTSDVEAAINREKQIKSWSRAKKIALIESTNPEWDDLSTDWYPDDDVVGKMIEKIKAEQGEDRVSGDSSLRSE